MTMQYSRVCTQPLTRSLSGPPWGPYLQAKVSIRNSSPHLCNSAILRTTKSIAELRTKKSCGAVIADLQNLTSAIPQLSTVSCQFRYFLVPFSSAQLSSAEQYSFKNCGIAIAGSKKKLRLPTSVCRLCQFYRLPRRFSDN
jgi:hypothetical protein